MTSFENEIVTISQITDLKIKYERFYSLLYIYTDGQHSDVVIKLLKEFIEEAEKESDLGYDGVFCCSLAYIYLSLGKKDLFNKCWEQARAKFSSIKIPSGIAMFLTYESVISWFDGKRNDGFDHIFKSIKQVEGTNYHEISGWSYFTLATYQFDSNQLIEAEENYHKSLTFFKVVDVKYGYARANNGLASIKIQQGKLQEAAAILNEIKDIYLSYDKLSGLSRTITDLGVIESKIGNYKKALELFNQAYAMRVETHNIQGQITSLIEMGKVFILLKNYQQAEIKLNLAVSLSEINNFKAKAYRTHELLAQLNKENKQPQVALEHMEKYFYYKTQVLADESTGRLKVLETQLLAEEALKRALIEKESNFELRKAYNIIALKNTEILQSIDYAKRIQKTILPGAKSIKQYFPNSFIFYRPKDVVAGDFYWMYASEKAIFFAVCDSTGHGVPGAFVSLVCNRALNSAVTEFNLRKPSLILDKVNEIIIEAFSGNEQEQVKDGMDASLIMFDFENETIHWAGANNPLWIFDRSEHINHLIEVKGDKQPIGKFDFVKPFTNHQIDYKKGNSYYLFSDGFSDQFGGPTYEKGGKKFSRKRLRELIISLSNTPMLKQEEMFENTFLEWKAGGDQIDDILVMGISL